MAIEVSRFHFGLGLDKNWPGSLREVQRRSWLALRDTRDAELVAAWRTLQAPQTPTSKTEVEQLTLTMKGIMARWRSVLAEHSAEFVEIRAALKAMTVRAEGAEQELLHVDKVRIRAFKAEERAEFAEAELTEAMSRLDADFAEFISIRAALVAMTARATVAERTIELMGVGAMMATSTILHATDEAASARAALAAMTARAEKAEANSMVMMHRAARDAAVARAEKAEALAADRLARLLAGGLAFGWEVE